VGQTRRDEEITVMWLIKNPKTRGRFARVFTTIFLAIFVLAVAGGFIVMVIQKPGAPTPGPIASSTP